MHCQYPHADCRVGVYRDGLCKGHWQTKHSSLFEDATDGLR